MCIGILKLTLASFSSHFFLQDQKRQGKNLNILRMKRAYHLIQPSVNFLYPFKISVNLKVFCVKGE